ncbi:hypothetical protein M422DRAFT_22808 [Sphaerobolus stellatus SS14]|nr:hypothetical protein M422DRAFT_22808 [Sphaerobolus stellatus SS14]
MDSSKNESKYELRDGAYSEASSSSDVGGRRRTSQISEGASDRRRLAIIETDPLSEMKREEDASYRLLGKDVSPHSNLFTRRGLDASRLTGLALVAPPDAKTDYASFTPVPASAPPTGITPNIPAHSLAAPTSGHQRSMSDAQNLGRRARDVGIVGTMGSGISIPSEISESPQGERRQEAVSTSNYGDSLKEPVFQTPRSRSTSPLPSASDTSGNSAKGVEASGNGKSRPAVSPLATSPAGQEKDVRRPSVAGPLVVEMGSGYTAPRLSPRLQSSDGTFPSPSSSRSGHSTADKDHSRTANRLPFKPSQNPSISYSHYQPGVHSTAGPLPPPPRIVPLQQNCSAPPPRPPRMLSPPVSRRTTTESIAAKTALEPLSIKFSQMPPTSAKSRGYSKSEHSAAVGSELPRSEVPSRPGSSRSLSTNGFDASESERAASTDQSDRISHTREGAFPPSTIITTKVSEHRTKDDAASNSTTSMKMIEEDATSDHSSFLASNTIEYVPLIETDYIPQEEETPISQGLSAMDDSIPIDETAADDSPPSSYASEDEGNTTAQIISPAMLSGDSLEQRRKASLPAPPPPPEDPPVVPNRRISQPPSLLSISAAVDALVSSPSPYPMRSKKPPSTWPDAMNFRDVLSLKTSAERAAGYAKKLQELASEESGLSDWLTLASRKDRRDPKRNISPSKTLAPNMPSSRGFAKQQRHISHGSMGSEMTFPIRQDAFAATDLTVKDEEEEPISPVSVPYNIPYPGAIGVKKRSSRLYSENPLLSPSSSTRSIGASIFASLGRKASIKKDNMPSLPTLATASARAPRSIQLSRSPTLNPSLPGGPRAPSRPTNRLHSVLTSKAQPTPAISNTTARPSMDTTPEAFAQQLDKLADLLPQADKDTLGGYLLRARGNDPMLAINAYLEDEKEGRLRTG